MTIRNMIGLLVLGALCAMTSCTGNTYSAQLKAEKKLIQEYLEREKINVIHEMPSDDKKWGEKDYYQVSGYDNLYFHLISRGDSIRIDSISPTREDTVDLQIISNDLIIARYKRFELTENADTLSYWTTLDQPYPTEFHYLNTSECDIVAWHLAISLMRYPDSQCEIIVPSKLGDSNAQQYVTPYVYILKIKVKQ